METPSRQMAEKLAKLEDLKSKVLHLRHEAIRLEGVAAALGDKALTMPEDIGEWTQSTPRIQGLVNRIRQTHSLSVEVAGLSRES